MSLSLQGSSHDEQIIFIFIFVSIFSVFFCFFEFAIKTKEAQIKARSLERLIYLFSATNLSIFTLACTLKQSEKL